jgi:hypothetical protein
MHKTTSPPAVVIPADAAAFAAQQGVQAEVPAVIEMTRRLFPQADINMELDDDPEIASDRHLVVRVRSVSMPVDQAVAARWEWHRGLLGCCPAPLLWVFRLGLELDS